MNIRKNVLAVMIAGAGFAGMAQAGTLSGNAATASADIVFTNPSELTNTLTAVSGLAAGSTVANTTLANGQLTTADGSENRYAVRIVNGEIHPSYENGTKIISGNNNSENKLGVYVVVSGSDTNEVIDGNTYRINNENSSGRYTVRTFGNISSINGGVINADTYTVQTEAYIYNA